MALILNLRFVDNVIGKADRVAKVTFRNLTYNSKVVTSAREVIYFGESFEWPIAREIEPDETLDIQIVNFNKYLSNKIVGKFTLILQALLEDGELKLCEPLVDNNNRQLESCITFEVRYFSPDGKVGMWDTEEFSNPLTEFNDDEFDGDDAESRARFALAETASLRSVGTSNDGGSVYSLEPGEDEEVSTAGRAFGSSRTAKQEMMDQDLHKPREFQICITIHEGQQLAGLNIDPVVRVQVGDEHKYSSIKQCTNTPYFNEYFVFDSNETPIILFDKMITLTVTDATGLPGRAVLKAANVVAGNVIGVFKCDVGTIYSAPDHMFYRKWAVLLNPKDISEGPKGYLKVDIAVVGRGDVPKKPPRMVALNSMNVRVPNAPAPSQPDHQQARKTDKDENNIEGNLLLPAGMPVERQKAAYRIVIHRADDIPRMDSGIMASVKKAITMSEAFVDAYVRVSFLGHKGKTSVKKSYNPEWKEQLTFIDLFPPLGNRIKVQLFDQDALSDDVIGTHFIELPQIMDPGGDTEGILPTFGPCWINFYGSPRNCNSQEDLDPLNEGVGEGAAYRGRLLISIKTELLDADMAGPSTVHRDKHRTSTKVEVAPKKDFMLFATLFDASIIDREYKDKEVYYELTIGMAGNNLDKIKEKKTGIFASSDTDSDDDEESSLLSRQKKKEPPLPCKSSSVPTVPRTDDNKNYYIPVGKDKPCMFVCAKFEDLRKRLYHANLLGRMVEQLDEMLDEARLAITTEKPNPHRLLRSAADEVIKSCDRYTRIAPSLAVGAGAGKTKLDSHRLKSCKTYVENFKNTAKRIKAEVDENNVKNFYKEARHMLSKLKHIAREPQHSLPDVIIWMVVDKKRVAYHRIPARHLLQSNIQELQGKYCAQMHNIFLKKPGSRNAGPSGWAVQSKLLIYLWLGLYDKAPKPGKSYEYLSGLPSGFEVPPPEISLFPSPLLPIKVTYEEEHVFKLRAYLYQGRNLVGSDDSGLSDPFARVIVFNQCQETLVVDETLSPCWDQVLVFDNVRIQGDAQSIINTPPLIIVEIYDYDTVGDPEFLGRSTLKPHIKLAATPYLSPEWPPRLQWVDVFRGPLRAGEILCAIEMLQGYDSEFMPLPEPVKRKKQMVIPLPMEIKPRLSKYRIEVMFWGVRELKRLKLLTVDRPRMDVECAGQVLKGTKLDNVNKNSNFTDTVKFMDVEMPDDEHYWPPITLRCVDCRSFGREVLVGTHTITNVQKYIYVSPEERMIKQQEKLRRRQQRRQELLNRLNAELRGDTYIPNGSVHADDTRSMGRMSQSMMTLDEERITRKKDPDTKSITSRASKVRSLFAFRSASRASSLAAEKRALSASTPNLAHEQLSLAPTRMTRDDASMQFQFDPNFDPEQSLAPSMMSEGGQSMRYLFDSRQPSIAPDQQSIAPSVMTEGGQSMQQLFKSREPSVAPDQQSLAPSVSPDQRSISSAGRTLGDPSLAPDQKSIAPSVLTQDGAGMRRMFDQQSVAPSEITIDGQGMRQMFESRDPSIAPDQQSLAPSIMIQDETGMSRIMDETMEDRLSVASAARSKSGSSREGSDASDKKSVSPSIRTQESTGMKQLFASREPSLSPSQKSVSSAGKLSKEEALFQRMFQARSVSRVGEDLGLQQDGEFRGAGDPDARSVTFSSRDVASNNRSVAAYHDESDSFSIGRESVVTVREAGSQHLVPRPSSVQFSQHSSSLSDEKDRKSLSPSKKSKITLKSILHKSEKGSAKGDETSVGGAAVAQTDVVIEMDTEPLVEGQTIEEEPAKLKESKIKSTLMDSGKDGKKNVKRKDLIAELDWWSKYYATKKDMDAKAHEEDDDFNDEFTGLDFGDLDPNSLKALQDMGSADELDDDDPIKKKMKKNAAKKKKKKDKDAKKKAKMAKKKAKAKLKSMKGIVNKAFKKDEEDEPEDDFQEVADADKSHIERIKIYNTELEVVPAFGGLAEWVNTFDLLRGKKLGDEEDDLARIAGKFKGTMTIYKLEDQTEVKEEEETEMKESNLIVEKTELRLSHNLPPTKTHEVLVRLYVIQCRDLHPADLNGKADPYLIIKIGKKEVNDKPNKKLNTLNPTFGRVFELDCTFPMESILKIQVFDYDKFSADDIIGETTIDLENRFFSKHRALCGFPNTYEIFGYNMWRDPMKPSHMLAKLCKDYHKAPPTYSMGKCVVDGHTFEGPDKVEDEHGNSAPTDEHVALEALKNWEDIAGFELVPEHIETRKLFISEKPGVEQGKIEMWVDMFPKDAPTPTLTVDITPRKPQLYELRVIIWNTDEVVLEDTNPITGEASSDIFVRGFLQSVGEDDQSTDVHYRSMSGEGNFNWRFKFPFEYLKAEEKILKKKSESLLSSESEEEKIPAKLTLQVWDADIVSADDFLGSIALDLNKMPRPAKDSKRATMKLLRKDGSVPCLNLFKQKRCKGWWPMEGTDEATGENTLVGKVEAELHLMTFEEAEKAPSGLGREAPDQLAEPNRPDSSFLWFMNPMKTLKFIIWRNYKWLMLKILLVLLAIAFILLFIYAFPGAMVNSMFN